MKERPILFSGEMVHALLAGRKTQTRRVVKMHADCHADTDLVPTRDGMDLYFDEYPEEGVIGVTCPYGKAGDRLWVRETWMPCNTLAPDQVQLLYKASNDERPDGMSIEDFGAAVWHANRPEEEISNFRADILRMDLLGERWCPSIFMPRWASRIMLEVVSVRLERLRRISTEDAWAEGCVKGEQWNNGQGWFPAEVEREGYSEGWDFVEDWYADLWNSINLHPQPVCKTDEQTGKKVIVGYRAFPWCEDDFEAEYPGVMDAKLYRGLPIHVTPNPWVWVVEFKRLEVSV